MPAGPRRPPLIPGTFPRSLRPAGQRGSQGGRSRPFLSTLPSVRIISISTPWERSLRPYPRPAASPVPGGVSWGGPRPSLTLRRGADQPDKLREGAGSGAGSARRTARRRGPAAAAPAEGWAVGEVVFGEGV